MSSKWSKAYFSDLAERVASTALATFIPTWIAAGNVAHLDVVNAIEISASAAGLTLLKGLLANLSGDQASASVVGVSSTKKKG